VITVLSLVLQIAITVLTADFVAGVVHWAEDTYIREDTPVLGKFMARPNIVHHHYPRHFTRLNWWQSSWDLLAVNALILLAAWAVGHLTWHLWLFAFVGANANQVHKWAHCTPKENGPLITFLQHIRLLQTSRHHAVHHTNPKDCHYCTITNFLNPMLDRVRFWDGLEWLLCHTLGLRRRPDTSLPGHGPAPAWLSEYVGKTASPN
jgi:ubiquitin-conjugating enzyme E2 variant